ncbi:hypothetical protein [Limibacillus sp. MBR-115]|jgi:hypothetical protein|uniref:hypothetical protein n=1 Tax=Limibacillus sp. MBR-115 TaxID=3156465 RepID=UPI00339890E7
MKEFLAAFMAEEETRRQRAEKTLGQALAQPKRADGTRGRAPEVMQALERGDALGAEQGSPADLSLKMNRQLLDKARAPQDRIGEEQRRALARDGFAFGPRGALLFDPASPQGEGQERSSNPLNLTPGRGLREGGAQPGILSGLAKDAGARFTPNSRERLARKTAFRQGLSQTDEAEFAATGKLLDEGMTALRRRRAASNDGLERKGLAIMEEDLGEMETDSAREKQIRETSVPSPSFALGGLDVKTRPHLKENEGSGPIIQTTEARHKPGERPKDTPTPFSSDSGSSSDGTTSAAAGGIQIASADTGTQPDASPSSVEGAIQLGVEKERGPVERLLAQASLDKDSRAGSQETALEGRQKLLADLERIGPEIADKARREAVNATGAAGPQTPTPTGEFAERQASLATLSPDKLDTQHQELTKHIDKLRADNIDSESDNDERTLVEHAILDQAAAGQRNGTIALYNSGPRERAMRDGLPAEFPVAENPAAESGPAIYEFDLQGIDAVNRHGLTIGKIAKEVGVDPTLLTAIIYTENARGWYGHLGEALNVSDTILPMNINPKKWSKYFDSDPSKASDPEANIRAGARLLKGIAARIPDASVAKAATLWNSMAKEEVSAFGARVRRIYEEKPWARSELEPDSP